MILHRLRRAAGEEQSLASAPRSPRDRAILRAGIIAGDEDALPSLVETRDGLEGLRALGVEAEDSSPVYCGCG